MSQKFYPTHAHGIAPINMALDLRDKVELEDVEAVTIEAYNRAVYNVGGDQSKPERVDPQTREDADHSIPWLVAVALRDGKLGPKSFTPETVRDPGLRPLMNKIKVIENQEFSRQYPKAHNMTMEIVTRSGKRHKAESTYPKGYLHNPLSDKELESKFTSMAEDVLGAAGCRKALDVLWHLDELKTLKPLFDAFEARSTRVSS